MGFSNTSLNQMHFQGLLLDQRISCLVIAVREKVQFLKYLPNESENLDQLYWRWHLKITHMRFYSLL